MAGKQSLTIWMNGERVGTWSRHSGTHELNYDPQWVISPRGRPLSLSLPFLPGNRPHTGELVGTFFENLLPDRQEVRTRIRERFRASSTQAFDLLAEIGRDCVGAVQLLNPEAPPPSVKIIRGVPLSDSDVAHQLEVAGGLRLPGFDLEDFRISLAGAQEKTAFLRHDESWQKPFGTTPSTHIFKLPMGVIDGQGSLGTHSLENEWLCSKIVAAYGLPVARTEIASFEHQQVLVVERFDRRLASDNSWWVRLPVEDFCQIKGVPSAGKYEADGGPGIDEVMKILERSTMAVLDREIFFKTQIIFWLMAAPDGHAKNFSIFSGPRGTFHLAPLYDIMSVYPWIGKTGNYLPVQKLKMAMAVRGKNPHYHWNTIQRRHWEATASRNGLKKNAARLINEVIDQTPEVIRTVQAELPADFPDQTAGTIFEGMRRALQRLSGG